MTEIIDDWKQPGDDRYTVRLMYDPEWPGDSEVYAELQQSPNLVVWGEDRPDIEDYIHRIYMTTLTREVLAIGEHNIRYIATNLGSKAFELIAQKIEEDGKNYFKGIVQNYRAIAEILSKDET